MQKYDAINNLGFYLDNENMDEAMKFMLTTNQEVNLRTGDNYTIKRVAGEDGSIFFEGSEVGKLASIYTTAPDIIIIKIATKIKGKDNTKIITWKLTRDAK